MRCHRKGGSPVNPDKRADMRTAPYRVRCKITAGSTVCCADRNPKKRKTRKGVSFLMAQSRNYMKFLPILKQLDVINQTVEHPIYDGICQSHRDEKWR